ncbi:hypothetical protein N9S72_00210 [Candidatus Arcticimaribacter]|jgi:hypothetical protein|nr:hypothetical protein [Candidatus Arcticimaribacter sp.]MDA9638523.1 hypothetical protein [Candidatus Arcticimaribacter sp.]|tara:strand:- start:227 stop:451 length:225 start_codon:yes stop_codon:yes gene_type:complete
MEVPKFLIADSSTLQDEIFVLHTDYPRFLLNVSNDEISWFEEFSKEDEDELGKVTEELIEQALTFFDSEIESLE